MQTRLALRLLEERGESNHIRVNGKSCFVKEESGDSCYLAFLLAICLAVCYKKNGQNHLKGTAW